MVSHSDYEKYHNLRQFNLLNVKQCTEVPSNIQHSNAQARVYVRAETKRVKIVICLAFAKKKKSFRSSIKYRRIDSTVWNYNTMPPPVTLHPLESNNFIRHLNDTN